MRWPLALASLLAGCASVAQAGVTIDDAPETADLQIRVEGERATYRRIQGISLLDDEGGASLRIEVRSRLEHRARAEDRVLEHVSYSALSMWRDGEQVPRNARLLGIEHLTVRTLLDSRGRPVEDPMATGRPATSPDLHSAVVAVVRLLRVSYPERPVAVGESWQVPPIEWDSPPSHRVAVVLEPRWTLRGFDRESDGGLVALVEWDASFRILPFAAMAGTTLEGEGRLVGTTRVRLDDGVTGRTELDITVSAGPSGAVGVGLFRFHAKYADEIERDPGAPRGLVSGVVPVSRRRIGSRQRPVLQRRRPVPGTVPASESAGQRPR